MHAPRLAALTCLALLAAPALAEAAAPHRPPVPVFRQYHGPAGGTAGLAALDAARGKPTGADAAGEPSLGIDPKTGAVYFMANKSTYRVHGFDSRRNDRATWTDITDPVIGAQSSDPILWTDPTTGRTFANQLELQGGSLQAYTDDGGKTWTHSTNGAGIGISFDHQSIVTGIPATEASGYPAPLNYPNYVYYCTNDTYGADCAVSIDGGLNFLASTPVYQNDLIGGACAAIFGHLKTDPRDGTVYLPPDGCNGKQGVFVSRDNTFSWTHSLVPGSSVGDSGHPSIAVGRQDGALYFAYGGADGWRRQAGRVEAAVSFDHGKTWRNRQPLGADLGVVASRFPVAVAGDRGRAAIAFLGAMVDGDPGLAPDPTNPNGKAYQGIWDLYVSFTLDGGRSWKTFDATPKDPIQRGPVCTHGTTCLSGRNLLDFNDMVLDRDGHVVIALSDGALGPKDTYAKNLAKATIVRQYGGPSLYADRR